MAGEIIKIQREVELELSNKETMQALVVTTFNGLSEPNIKQAMVEGYLRGFTLKNFLEKDIYAIPFRDKYALVTSIDHARKIGMRSGIVGKGAPIFEEDNMGNIISCSVTVKRKLPNSEIIGDFTATVYFAEYVSQKPIWQSKPRTMLAKVAEAHALRMACPEELSQAYVEEEMERKDGSESKPVIDISEWEKKLKETKSLDELKSVWASTPAEAKAALGDLKDALKEQYQQK